MTNGLSPCLLLVGIIVAMAQGDFVEPPPSFSMRTLAEEKTILPCRFELEANMTQVVQVSWYKVNQDGKKDQIMTAHYTHGHTAFGSWSSRVSFLSNTPTVDSSLVLHSTEGSDEGTYICQIITFPSGNLERPLSLTVWIKPISNLDPVVLVEGQTYRTAATCRAIASPPPHITWDTELNGMPSNRTSERGSVTSNFMLHPLRSMNGKKLDCVVWHPALEQPHRITNNLVVHFPPHADISGYDEKWHVGLETATLRCVTGGNPKPQSFTWTRKGGVLPEGVIPHPNGTLEFGRSLSLSDAGIYQCAAKNDVGLGKAEVKITVGEIQEKRVSFESTLVFILGAAAAGLLLLMVVVIISVTCHHKRRNKKLEEELVEKREEINTLSRHASFRRMNSVSTDTKGATEENIPLRVEGTLRTSLSSLGDQARCHDSHSTLSGGRGVGGGLGIDYLGRPLLYTSRRGRERMVDEESRSYVRDSNMSLETRLHPPLLPSPIPGVPSAELLRSLNGSPMMPAEGGSLSGNSHRTQQHSPLSCSYPHVTDDEDEEDEGLGGLMTPASQGRPDDQDSGTNGSQISDAHNPHFHQSNGTVRAKACPSPMTINPHTSHIHKAQIV